MPRHTSSTSPSSGRSKSGAPETSAAQNHVRGPSQEEISRRAYELFLARGAGHGHDVEDWLQAERELRLGRY